MNIFKALPAVLLLAVLIGCAGVDADDIQKFGVATTSVAVATRDARTIDNRLVNGIRTEEQATQFARGGGAYRFPPDFKPPLATGEVWDARIAYAVALADYGTALAKAASGVNGPDIDTAVDNLQKAVETAAPKLAAMKNVEPVSDAATAVAKRAITQAALQRIRAAMSLAHPSIVKGRDLLAADFALVADRAQEHYGDWVARKQAALNTIRSNGSAREKYEAYRAFLAEQQSLADAVALLVPGKDGGEPGYVALLDKMVAAHKALAEGSQNPQTLDDFLHAASQVWGLIDTFSSGGKPS